MNKIIPYTRTGTQSDKELQYHDTKLSTIEQSRFTITPNIVRYRNTQIPIDDNLTAEIVADSLASDTHNVCGNQTQNSLHSSSLCQT